MNDQYLRHASVQLVALPETERAWLLDQLSTQAQQTLREKITALNTQKFDAAVLGEVAENLAHIQAKNLPYGDLEIKLHAAPWKELQSLWTAWPQSVQKVISGIYPLISQKTQNLAHQKAPDLRPAALKSLLQLLAALAEPHQ